MAHQDVQPVPLSPIALVWATNSPEWARDPGPVPGPHWLCGWRHVRPEDEVSGKKNFPLLKLCILCQYLALTFRCGLRFGVLDCCLALWELRPQKN